MPTKIIIISILIITLLSNCNNPKSEIATQENKPITTIEIFLYPSFNYQSVIQVDVLKNTIRFKVDTATYWRHAVPPEFVTRLDSFKTNTLIDSFYSQCFLDSIRQKKEFSGMLDGLDITTVIGRDNQHDTISSGNLYPAMLERNIISQIDYIVKHVSDKPLLSYLKDLKGYF